MSESQFIQEAKHRAALLTGSFNPGKAIVWVQRNDNRQRILCLQEETRKYLSYDSTPQAVSFGVSWMLFRRYKPLFLVLIRGPWC